MNKKTTDIVSYLTIVGWAIAYFFGTKNESKYHLNQALVLGILEIIVGLAQKLIGGIIFIGSALKLISFVIFILWVVALYSAVTEKPIHIPFVSDVKIL